MPQSTLTHLECSLTGETYEADQVMNLAPNSQRPLLARYDLAEAAKSLTPENLIRRKPGMWRYREVLPVRSDANVIDLGEGSTPLLKAARLGETIGCPNTYIKDESLNPTGSFKARGLGMAVSRAKELGESVLAIPSAGNAAGAMCAYAAAGGLEAHVYMPRDVPHTFKAECQAYGGSVTLVDGLITDCGAKVAEGVQAHGWFDLSTLKEPYRLEGKKTMGYEIAEQFDWTLPDVIIYPTGGGTGLVGMWKAFAEMEEMGLIGSKRPRMVSVQTTGCAPIVRAYDRGERFADEWENAATIADGLRVPKAVGDFLILDAVRASEGTAITVTDEAIMESVGLMASLTGVFPAPEAAACLEAQRVLLSQYMIGRDETVVLFNTGTSLKYTHLFD